MPRVRVGDIEMHYVEAGAGEPVVLIMGIGGDHTAWAFQIRAFAERYRVIAFDNRGAGQTDQPDAPCTIALMADDTAGLMDRLAIARAHVVGVSMGGMIAQEVALRAPGRVRSLQLHATLARPDAYTRQLLDVWRVQRAKLTLAERMRAQGLWLFAPVTYAERPEFVETVVQNAIDNPHPQSLTGFVRQAEAVAGHDALDRVGAIACPTLVTVGEEDVLVPPRFARELAARIPGAELTVVPEAGHAYMWERPDIFNRICLDFLARLP